MNILSKIRWPRPFAGLRGITLHLSEVKGAVMDRLERSHFLEELTGKVHRTQFDAVSSIKVRVGYDRWALTTDVVYMGLGTSRNGVSVDLEQWVVEPTLSSGRRDQ